MKLTSHTPHKKARIEIIPLIDIMFFLLASFMLVAMSMVKLQAIQTNLPASNTSTPIQKPDFVAIGVDKEGKYYFDKDKSPIDPDTIPARLQPFYASKRDDLKVFVNADQDASYNAVITALDEVRSVGITKVSFAVKKNNHFDPAGPRPNTHPDTDANGARQRSPRPAAPAAPAAPPPRRIPEVSSIMPGGDTPPGACWGT